MVVSTPLQCGGDDVESVTVGAVGADVGEVSAVGSVVVSGEPRGGAVEHHQVRRPVGGQGVGVQITTA
jgi:hypothetical protein